MDAATGGILDFGVGAAGGDGGEVGAGTGDGGATGAVGAEGGAGHSGGGIEGGIDAGGGIALHGDACGEPGEEATALVEGVGGGGFVGVGEIAGGGLAGTAGAGGGVFAFDFVVAAVVALVDVIGTIPFEVGRGAGRLTGEALADGDAYAGWGDDFGVEEFAGGCFDGDEKGVAVFERLEDEGGFVASVGGDFESATVTNGGGEGAFDLVGDVEGDADPAGVIGRYLVGLFTR